MTILLLTASTMDRRVMSFYESLLMIQMALHELTRMRGQKPAAKSTADKSFHPSKARVETGLEKPEHCAVAAVFRRIEKFCEFCFHGGVVLMM